jgi:hypothetical protein
MKSTDTPPWSRALSIRIDANTSAILSVVQAPTDPRPDTIPAPSNAVSLQRPPSSFGGEKYSDISVASHHLPFLPEKLSKYLSELIEPVGLCHHYWNRVGAGALVASYVSGPVIVRKWSLYGREVFVRVPVSSGYAVQFAIQCSRLLRGKISITCFCLYDGEVVPKLSIRWNLHWVGLFSFGSPVHKAIQRGDVTYLRHQLSSRRLGISDVTVMGDTLLHVRGLPPQHLRGYTVIANRPSSPACRRTQPA